MLPAYKYALSSEWKLEAVSFELYTWTPPRIPNEAERFFCVAHQIQDWAQWNAILNSVAAAAEHSMRKWPTVQW